MTAQVVLLGPQRQPSYVVVPWGLFNGKTIYPKYAE